MGGRLLGRIDALLGVLCRAVEGFNAVLLATMLGINAINIVVRGVADDALDWVWPWTMTLFVWWVLLALFPLYRLRKDVSIYFLLRHSRPRFERVLGTFVHLVILVAMAVLVYMGPERLASARGTIEIVGLPRWWLVVPLIFSASLVALDALVNIVAIGTGERTYEPFGRVEANP